jgi:diadenosine hexaphosphate hydrolase (ATP-forming)
MSARRRSSRRSPSKRRPLRVVPGAGGVVFNHTEKVLLLGHISGHWVFPKGHIDPGESALEAALREVEEEAGVVATCSAPDFVAHTRYTNRRRETREISWFALFTEASAPILRERIFPRGAFFPPSEAARKLSFAEDRVLLEEMLEWKRDQPHTLSQQTT